MDLSFLFSSQFVESLKADRNSKRARVFIPFLILAGLAAVCLISTSPDMQEHKKTLHPISFEGSALKNQEESILNSERFDELPGH